MLASRNLRWAGPGISNGRQRLVLKDCSVRNFSVRASTPRTQRSTRPLPSFKHNFAQQSRSLSLFGWGGSSKVPSDSASSATVSNSDIGSSGTGLDNVRTVKATHGTSDAPDPSQAHLHPPNAIEPQIIENLQETLTLPHGNASGRITEIVSGDVDISSASERMGYLKEVCGLDFGWGPSTVMENLLEWLHVGAGLSWTASIVAVALILRLAMVKPIIDSQIQGKKMREMAPYMQPIREQYMRAMNEKNRAKAAELGAQMKELTKASGVSYARAFVPLLIQLPFSFGAFRVLRNAGQLPVPAFVTEDWLWTTDLSFSDPYYITPAISSAAIYFSFKLQQTGTTTMFGPQMMKVFGTVLPLMSFVFMSFQPGSVQLYFMTTGVMAYGTTALLRQQWFRDYVNLGPLPTGPPPTAATPGTTSPTSTTASKTPPSNIQLVSSTTSPAPEPVKVEDESQVNRSRIDKIVDNVKGQWKGLVDSNSKGIFNQKMQDMEKKRQQQSDAAYEAQAKRSLGKVREARNEAARKQSR